MGNLGRKPVTLLQIDLPYCTRTYGTAPCAAVLGTTGAAKCFNSLKTCQDRSNYEAGTKTLTFGYNQDGNPDIAGLFPALTAVDSRPGSLNLSGLDPDSGALGVRARVKATLQDFTNNDTWLDKYQSERVSGAALASGIGYNPLNRGHFLARTFARFPYYDGIPARTLRGYVGDDIGDMDAENYVMTALDGPNAGGVVDVTMKDIFDLADDVIPAVSTGKLAADMALVDESFTFSLAGAGDGYAASGVIRIGTEIMWYTRAGDTMSVARGQDGTTIATHKAGDVVQECYEFGPQTIAEVAETIFKYNTTAFDAFIPTVDWTTENTTWYGGLTLGRVVISVPTVKTQLIGELCALGCMFWWDPTAQEIKFRINAPLLPDESYYPINDESGLIEGSVDIGRSEDQRISSLWMYHAVDDWTGSMTDSANFNNLTIASVSENDYGIDAQHEFFTRWFGREGNDATIKIISERLVSRYRDTPHVVSGTLDAKDRPAVNLGARVLVETYGLQDIDGAVLAVPMQVNYVEGTEDRVKFRAETFNIDGNFAFWMDSATAPADYDSATEAQRATGAFWADAENPLETDNVYF
jgi:hypothetical protein